MFAYLNPNCVLFLARHCIIMKEGEKREVKVNTVRAEKYGQKIGFMISRLLSLYLLMLFALITFIVALSSVESRGFSFEMLIK